MYIICHRKMPETSILHDLPSQNTDTSLLLSLRLDISGLFVSVLVRSIHVLEEFDIEWLGASCDT